MADGDPMVLKTIYGTLDESLLNNGTFEKPAQVGYAPTGWTKSGPAPYFRIASGTRTGGDGLYYANLTDSTGLQLEVNDIFQNVTLNGSDSLDARGHAGMSFTASTWARADGSAMEVGLLNVWELNSSGGIVATHSAGLPLSGVWAQSTLTGTIDHADCVALRFYIQITNATAGTVDLKFDDAQLYFPYTFAANPSMPDDQDIFDPTEKYARTISGSLVMGSGAAGSAKHQKMLNFGLIGLDQFKALRSLRLLKRPMRWTPNQPHMPASLDVRMTAFKFGAGRGAFGSNIYRGSMELSEI